MHCWSIEMNKSWYLYHRPVLQFCIQLAMEFFTTPNSVCIATALFGRMHIKGGWPLQGFATFVHFEISRLYCDEYGIKPLPFEYQLNWRWLKKYMTKFSGSKDELCKICHSFSALHVYPSLGWVDPRTAFSVNSHDLLNKLLQRLLIRLSQWTTFLHFCNLTNVH